MKTQTLNLIKCKCFCTLKLPLPFIILIVTGLYCLRADAQTVNDTYAGKVNGVWWIQNNILEDAAAFARMTPDEIATLGTTPVEIKDAYPPTVGVFTTVTWSSLAPTLILGTNNPDYNWDPIDEILESFADEDFLIMLMIWVGPDAPEWIYDPPFNVPEVDVVDKDENPVSITFPYYLYTRSNGTMVYKQLWYQMMEDVRDHIQAYPNKIRNRVVVVQSAEGSTGDEDAYQNYHADDTQYDIPRSPDWRNFKRAAWKFQDTLYRVSNPNYQKQIHLLVNCDPDDPEDAGNWLNTNVPYVWRKANTVGHGYQFNDERLKKVQFDPLINTIYTDSLTLIRCRDEMDQYGNDKVWQKINPRQYNFYQAASALYFGLDIWPNNSSGLLNTTDYQFGFDFFTRYAGKKNKRTAQGGFCVLREGLDAEDPIKFPDPPYTSGTSDTEDDDGMQRCEDIASTPKYAISGAGQDDAEHAQGAATNQYKAQALNDVGWNIHIGNYERYVTQYIDATDQTKNGWPYWRIGTENLDNWYGRFAKGFRHSQSRDSLFFIVDDSLFTGNRPLTCTLHIAYFDTGTVATGSHSWKVLYDAHGSGNGSKVLGYVDNHNTREWIDVYVPLTDAHFTHRGKHGSDIVIVNVDDNNEIFALVEILKPSP